MSRVQREFCVLLSAVIALRRIPLPVRGSDIALAPGLRLRRRWLRQLQLVLLEVRALDAPKTPAVVPRRVDRQPKDVRT